MGCLNESPVETWYVNIAYVCDLHLQITMPYYEMCKQMMFRASRRLHCYLVQSMSEQISENLYFTLSGWPGVRAHEWNIAPRF